MDFGEVGWKGVNWMLLRTGTCGRLL
jgi:hypothetical protein